MGYTPKVPVIRNKNRAGIDNPLSGAIQVIPVQFDDIGNSETVAWQFVPPTGMVMQILDISVKATAVTTVVALTIGTAAAGTQILASTGLTTNLGSLTLKTAFDGQIDENDVLDLRLVADAGGDAESVSANIVAFVSKPPDSVYLRGTGHF